MSRESHVRILVLFVELPSVGDIHPECCTDAWEDNLLALLDGAPLGQIPYIAELAHSGISPYFVTSEMCLIFRQPE